MMMKKNKNTVVKDVFIAFWVGFLIFFYFRMSKEEYYHRESDVFRFYCVFSGFLAVMTVKKEDLVEIWLSAKRKKLNEMLISVNYVHNQFMLFLFMLAFYLILLNFQHFKSKDLWEELFGSDSYFLKLV